MNNNTISFQLQYFYSFQLHYFCNFLFIYKHFCSKAPSVFSHVFILASNTLEQNTRFALHGPLIKPRCNTSKYGTNPFVASAIASWNFFQKEFPSNDMRQISYSQLKVLIKNQFFNSYNQISKICYTTKTMFIFINKLSFHTGNIVKLQ